MIEKTDVVKDPNGMWQLRLQVTDLKGEDSHFIKFPQGEERIEDTYKFFYKENQDGFVSYGAIQKKDTCEHKAGYIWSSRASLINVIFDKQALEISLVDSGDQLYSANMTVEKVLSHLENMPYHLQEVLDVSKSGEVLGRHYHILADNNDNKQFYLIYGENAYRKHESVLYPKRRMGLF